MQSQGIGLPPGAARVLADTVARWTDGERRCTECTLDPLYSHNKRSAGQLVCILAALPPITV
jgi:hypothetical protein